MAASLDASLAWLLSDDNLSLLDGIRHGIEKEGLRVNAQGTLSQTPHPSSLGSALTHGSITTDYSEALLEFITPAHKDVGDALQDLSDLHTFTLSKLGTERIWCGSMPCDIANEADIPVAYYGDSNIGRLKHIYRQGLNYRYGKMMQCIAGIHYNFSMPEAFWPAYQTLLGDNYSLCAFRSEQYFKLIRNFRRRSWLLLYLFGASPALASSFMKGKNHSLETWDDETLYLPYATSLRMSDLGYSNKAQASLNICFNHLETYTNSLSEAIKTPHAPYQAIGVKVDDEYRQLNSNILQIENEYYSDIRPKRVTRSGEKPVHALRARGVEYVEVRNTDINPFLPTGISQQQADFMDVFLVGCLLGEATEIGPLECRHLEQNNQRVVNEGRRPGLTLKSNGKETPLQTLGEDILAELNQVAACFDQLHNTQRYSEAVAAQQAKLHNSELTPSAQVLAEMKKRQCGHSALIQALNEAHYDAMMAAPLSPEKLAEFEQKAADSLKAQDAIKGADSLSFDAFLAAYIAD